jgi:hypothetical protein
VAIGHSAIGPVSHYTERTAAEQLGSPSPWSSQVALPPPLIGSPTAELGSSPRERTSRAGHEQRAFRNYLVDHGGPLRRPSQLGSVAGKALTPSQALAVMKSAQDLAGLEGPSLNGSFLGRPPEPDLRLLR